MRGKNTLGEESLDDTLKRIQELQYGILTARDDEKSYPHIITKLAVETLKCIDKIFQGDRQ